MYTLWKCSFPEWLLLRRALQNSSRLFTLLWWFFCSVVSTYSTRKVIFSVRFGRFLTVLILLSLRSVISVFDDCWEKDFLFFWSWTCIIAWKQKINKSKNNVNRVKTSCKLPLSKPHNPQTKWRILWNKQTPKIQLTTTTHLKNEFLGMRLLKSWPTSSWVLVHMRWAGRSVFNEGILPIPLCKGTSVQFTCALCMKMGCTCQNV